ncbi:MAG TPA: hypothetical protein VLA04_04850 [Verrucomicrobiae bacterium]|nr:hypothetical protein [Verrucomicrobiae bacterium]
MRTIRTFLLGLLAAASVGTTAALAVAPQFDTVKDINLEDIYSAPQEITNVFEETGVYGKLDSYADVYKFTASQDGEQTIALMGVASSKAQPYLVLLDPTDVTEARELGIPVPGEGYHTSLVKPVEGLKVYNETLLFQKYNLYAEERIKLQKDKTYYLIVFDAASEMKRYTIRFGDGKVWSGGDLFLHFGSWLKVKADSYGGTSPFDFTPATFGSILFFLSFAILLGMWVIESTFAFLAAKTKMAGYLLIKLQYYGRIFTWIGLWFMAIGGYIYFGAAGWPGIPFILAIVFILMAAVFITRSFVLSPKLMAIEVTKQEAAIPKKLQKLNYLFFVLSVITVGSFLTLLTVHLS